MCSMILQFRREEENMCGHRGLLPGSEQQTYTILAPRNLRLMYERLINQAKKTSNISAISHHGADGFLNGAATLEYTSDKILASYFNINRFFSAFIDHVRDFYSIKIKLNLNIQIILKTGVKRLGLRDPRKVNY